MRDIKSRLAQRAVSIEKYLDDEPLGQKISAHYRKFKEIVTEGRGGPFHVITDQTSKHWVLQQNMTLKSGLSFLILVRQRIRKGLAEYVKKLEDEN